MFFLRRVSARIGRRVRLAAAGSCLLLALGSALGAARRPPATPPPTRAVVVAARDLPAGHVLAMRDLAVARWPPALAPAGTTVDARRLVGETLTGPLARREAVTRGRLLGSDLTTGLAPGTAAIAVTLAADAGALLHVGDRIDLVAVPAGALDLPGAAVAEPSPPAVVATDSLVLAVLPGAGASGFPATRLVLAATRSTALRIAGLSSTRAFAAVANHP